MMNGDFKINPQPPIIFFIMAVKLFALHKYLDSASREELVKEINDLYKLFPAVQEYYQAKLSDVEDGEDALLKKYKKIVKNEFMPDRGLGKARLSIARKAIADFKKIAKNKNNIADIMVYYVEMGVEFTNAYGDIDESFYNSMEGMYDAACEYIKIHNLTGVFIQRMRQMVQATSGIGWGFHDDLSDMFHNYFGKYE